MLTSNKQNGNLFFGIAIALCGTLLLHATTQAADKVTFEDHVMPLFRNHCLSCHNGDQKKGDLDLSTFHAVLQGGGGGDVVASGNSGESRLWKLVNHQDTPHMPPKKPKLPDAELAIVKNWIDGGLLENAGAKAIVSKKPKVELGLSSAPVGRPKGDPPMPSSDLLLEPVVRAPRAGAITAMATSPWAPLVAIGGQKQVLLYNTDTLEPAGILPFEEGFPYITQFSRSARLLLVAGGVGAKTGKAVIFDVVSGKRITEVGDEYDAVMAADISGDQTQVAIGGTNKLIKLYSTADGSLLHTIKKHTDWVTAVAFSPDGVLLVTGDRNGGVHVWEAYTGRIFYTFKGHNGAITDIAWRDDSNIVATASEDGQVMLWEMHRGTRVRNWGAHGGGVTSIDAAHDNRWVTSGRDGVVKLWDANGGQQRVFSKMADLALHAVITHDQKRVIGGDWSGSVRVWESADGKVAGDLEANPPTLAMRIEEDQKQTQLLKETQAKLLADLQAKETAMNAARTAMAAAQKLVTDTAAAAKAADAQLVAVKQAQVKAQADVETYKKTLAAEQAKAKAANDAAVAAVAKLNQVNADVKNLEGELAKKTEGAKAVADAAASAKKAAEMNAEDKTLATAAAMLAEAVGRANKVVTDAQAMVDAKAAESKTMVATVASTKAGAEQAVAAVKAAETQMVAMTKAFNDATAAIKPATDALAQAKAQADAAVKAMPVAEAAVKSAGEALAKSKQAHDAGNSNIAAIESRIKRWQLAQFNVKVIESRMAFEKVNADYRAKLDYSMALSEAEFSASDELEAAEEAVKNGPKNQQKLEAAVAAATTNLANANTAMAAAKTKLAEMEKLAATAASVIKAATDARDQTGKAHQGIQALVQASTQALAGAQAQAKQSADLAATMPDQKELQAAAAAAKQAADVASAALESAKAAETALANSLAEKTKALADAEQAAKDAAEAVVKSKAEVAAQPALVKQATDALALATGNLQKHQAEMASLPPRIAALKVTVAQAAKDAEAARNIANAAVKELLPLQKNYEALSAEYAKLKG